MSCFVLNLDPVIKLTNQQFYSLCQANRDLKVERNAEGELVIMSLVGGEGGTQEAGLIAILWHWNLQTGLGKMFSSSTLFSLPNGSDRSPNAAWVSLERWQSLSSDQQRQFPPLTPDFVIELRSPTDRLKLLQDKMQEYLDNGLRLGWLIDVQNQQVEIYRPDQPVETVQLPAELSGEKVLPGFMLTFP